MTVLVDSWAWIEYFKGTTAGGEAAKIIESGQQLLVSAVNLSEIYCFLLRTMPAESERLVSFVTASCFVIPVEAQIALNAAKIKVSRKIGLADAIIMATAEENNATILTGDDDFKGVKNVIYIGK